MTNIVVSPEQCYEAIKETLQAGLVPVVKASPGVGKSWINQQIAKDFNLKLIDFRLTTADPTDLQGFPSHSKDGTRMGYLPPENIPLEGDSIPEGYNGWYLFFDEITSAFPSLQAASYKIMLDKMVGQHHIHKNCVIAAAGNLTTDKAITFQMSTALQSRLVHFTLQVNNSDWQKWALDYDIDYRIRAFLKWKPDLLHNFKPDHSDETFACPRTWEFASRFTKRHPDDIDTSTLICLAGTVGNGPAIEFQGFTKIYNKLPKMEDIQKNPDSIVLPEEPSVMWALSSLLCNKDNVNILPKVMPFVNRLPMEFQVWTLRGAIKIKPELLNVPEINAWKIQNADKLY